MHLRSARRLFLLSLPWIGLPAALGQTVRLEIAFAYDGQLGRYGIADSARALQGGNLVAEARALRIIERRPGPNQLEIVEKHYAPGGETTYEGRMILQFAMGGARVVSEDAIFGRKRFQFFNNWPS